MLDTVFKQATIVTYAGLFNGNIGIHDGKIVSLSSENDTPASRRVIDCSGRHVLPGLIDPHTHIGANRRVPYEELAWTETQAAAAGGVTTVMQYARFKDSYLKVFDDYWATASKNATVDLFFHFTLEAETQVPEIPEYAHRWGIRLFKLYIGGYPPGNEIGLSLADSAMLYDTMLAARELTPTGTVAVHCEDVHIIEHMIHRAREQGRQGLSTWTEVRPSFAEEADIRRAAFLARVTGCPLYIPHTTVGGALEVLRDAIHAGKPKLYLETCPQYLILTKDSDVGIAGKCNPPLRDEGEQTQLWSGLQNGLINYVGSDHVSTTKGLQGDDLWKEIPGFAGLETTLPLMLSEGVNKQRISLPRLVEVCSTNPARLFGLYPRKGTIEIGSDADLVVVDLNQEQQVRPERMYTKGTTIYGGRRLKGWPVLTMVRGRVVMENGTVQGERGFGQILNTRDQSS